jgi:hypothetical protein
MSPDGGYLAKSLQGRLPKASIGKSCNRFKRPGELDQNTLEALLREAAPEDTAVVPPPGKVALL